MFDDHHIIASLQAANHAEPDPGAPLADSLYPGLRDVRPSGGSGGTTRGDESKYQESMSHQKAALHCSGIVQIFRPNHAFPHPIFAKPPSALNWREVSLNRHSETMRSTGMSVSFHASVAPLR
jgi:hypothetical protein